MIPEDVEYRLAMDEYSYLMAKYPNVAFNLKPDRPYSDGTKPPLNDVEHGFKHLVMLEPRNMIPKQWDVNIIKQFDSCITYNSKFYEMYKDVLKLFLIKGCTFFNNYYELDTFPTYEEKKVGVCFINKVYPCNEEGCVIYLREKVLMELQVEPHLIKHVWSPVWWGGEYYQGPTEFYKPSHINILSLISKYRFRVCFESIYHPLWSWDFITERMFDCFKAKTVPIYFGCYNIEEHVPKDFFIDYRDFDFDNKALSDFLVSFPKSRYIEMTEAAYEWNKTCDIGRVEDLENILCTLS